VDPHLEKLQREISAAISTLSREQMQVRPEGKWSTAEILEHLYLTYAGTVKGFGRVLAADKPLAGKPTWKNRAQAWVVVGIGYIPGGREAPERSRPRGASAETVLAEIGPEIARMDEVIAQCETRFGRTMKVLDHPILGPLSAPQWRKFHLIHGLHHLQQIRRLCQLQ